MEALRRAIQQFGTQAALAEKIELRQSHIAMWLHRGNVPAEHCPDIEWATGGQVRCEELRPDVRWHVVRGKRPPRGWAGR